MISPIIMKCFKVISHNYMWILKSKEDPYFKVSSIKSVAFCGVCHARLTSVGGSFSDNFNFSMKKASRAYNFCFISKRHIVFNWQSVGHIKTKLNAQRYKKDWNKFIFWLFKCLKFLPSRFTVLVTHSITCMILPLSNIIICFKLSYPWKQTTEQ